MNPSSRAVWMIIPTYFPVVGGAQVQVQQISEALVSQGRQVAVLTRQHSSLHPQGLPPTEMRGRVLTRRLFSRGGGKTGAALFLLNGLWFLLRQGRAGIYHAHDAGAAGWLAIAARYLFGGRCLVKLRTGTVAYEKSLRSRLRRWQFQVLLRCADRVIVVNREVQDFLQSLGIPAERVVRIPNGVDGERFTPATASEKAAARRRLGIGEDGRVVLYVGRLEYMKGVDVLLGGWRRMNPAMRPGCRLILVGDGPERGRLERTAEAGEISESVHFAGEQQVEDYYRAADLFVLPSRTEGLSNALLEAMACGLPVLASDVGGAKDLVHEGQNGYFFKSEDEQILAERLELLLNRPDTWENLGRMARRSVLANASLASAIQSTRQLYQELEESLAPRRAGLAATQEDRS